MRSLVDVSVLFAAAVDQLGNHEAAFLPVHRFTRGQHQEFCSIHSLADGSAALFDLF